MGKKKTKWAYEPNPTKSPKLPAESAKSGDGEIISWHLRTADLEGPWGWKSCNPQAFWDLIGAKIGSFEQMTWGEIVRGGSHSVPIGKLVPDAQKRLSEINQDDVDDLFSLRLSGKQRILGIRTRSILKVLWWDPEHTACPSEKKHT